MKYRCLLCQCLWLTLFLTSPATMSQSTSEFDQWKQQFLTELDTYKDEVDREFAGFLKTKWREFTTEEGVKRDPVPKPLEMPRDEPKSVAVPKPVAPVTVPYVLKTENLPRQPSPVTIQGEKVKLIFLGHEIALYTKIDREFTLSQTINQSTLQNSFDRLAKSDYQKLIADLAKIRHQFQLNDWAYMQLIRQFSDAFLSKSNNSATLLSWFLLLKSDIKSRIAFANNIIYLLMSTRQPLFNVTYFEFDSERFYIISKHATVAKKLYSYNGTYPKKLKKSNLAGINKVITATSLIYRDISFNYGGTQFDLRVPFNQHAIEFLATYPQMDFEHYFNVAISQETQQALLAQLKPIVSQLNNKDAVNFLLSLVQNGFNYETDEVQFGEENYLFLEETIFYPSSDCEDRSVIFAWLVKNLLNINVVGLHFPGHFATAVQLDQPSGEVIENKGVIYTVADPTYINATVGKKMPQFKNISPKVINFSQ